MKVFDYFILSLPVFMLIVDIGKCLSRFSNAKTPYCIRFNPDVDKSHLFVVGCADKKIYTVSLVIGKLELVHLRNIFEI